MSNANKRHANLRRRRRDAGWTELVLWVPRNRAAEVKAAIIELVGKPPGPVRGRPRRYINLAKLDSRPHRS